MNELPFQLTLSYNEQEIINRNFTIKTQLNQNKNSSIYCENNHYRSCLVDLILQIQSDSILLLDIWCQSPAISFANFHQYQTTYTCISPGVDANEQPMITMIINSKSLGKILPITTANFTYIPEYSIKRQGNISINITVKINFEKY